MGLVWKLLCLITLHFFKKEFFSLFFFEKKKNLNLIKIFQSSDVGDPFFFFFETNGQGMPECLS